MKPYNEQEFNRLCAEFLGYVNTTPTDPDFNIYENKEKPFTVIPEMIETMSMKFHSDWNWIMEVVEKINDTPIEDGLDKTIDAKYLIFQRLGKTHKSAVVQAIWEFLNWYNENKL